MRVLAIDIETSPNQVLTWGLFKQNVSLSQIVEPARVMCFAAKWVGAKRMMFHSEHHDGHEEMVLRAHDLLDQADAVLHYNGKRFDVPHLNREFLLGGLGPPAPYHQIDLLQVARRQFKFQSNKLEHVSTQLGHDGKVSHSGMHLWRDCMAGDAKAWRLMKRYNCQDVKLLEDIYNQLLPWIPAPPSRTLHDGGASGCPRCGSSRLQSRGWRHASTSSYRLWRCSDCGGWTRSTKRDNSVDVVAL